MQVAGAEAGVEAFHFGTAERTLFGCHHRPAFKLARDSGVVLCNAVGGEYMRSHRAYRQLAIRLSNLGFHVLRFDYYGCGDSGGDDHQGRLTEWTEDIRTAIAELSNRSGSAKVGLVGLRLGAALAMLAGVKHGRIGSLVLWDPIVSGGEYLAQLSAVHTRSWGDSPVVVDGGSDSENVTEILGMPFTQPMLAELTDLDLLAVCQRPADDILIIESHEQSGNRPLKEHLNCIGSKATFQSVPSPRVWSEEEHALIPVRILQAIASWVSEDSA